MKTRIVSVLLTVFCLAGATLKAQDGKFAMASMDSIVMSLPEFKTQQKILESYSKQLSATMEQKQKEFQQKYGDYQQNAANWIPEVIQEKEKELQMLQQSLQEFQQTAQQNLMKKENDILQPLYEKASKGIQTVAKEKGYEYVLPRQSLLYGNQKHNITVAVIEKLGGDPNSIPENPSMGAGNGGQ